MSCHIPEIQAYILAAWAQRERKQVKVVPSCAIRSLCVLVAEQGCIASVPLSNSGSVSAEAEDLSQPTWTVSVPIPVVVVNKSESFSLFISSGRSWTNHCLCDLQIDFSMFSAPYITFWYILRNTLPARTNVKFQGYLISRYNLNWAFRTMSSPALLLLNVALHVHSAQARNDTLVHGWTPEPSGRGTWSILWGCLATIFICTWSALHLHVPQRHGRWYLFFRKLGWMLMAATAPEFVVYKAAKNFFEAKDLLKHLHSQGHQEWSLVHVQFAYANGFRTRTPLGEESKCNPYLLETLIKDWDVHGPSISEDELKSRGKSDWAIKLIAVVQIIWFVVQTLVRAIQYCQTTPLELMTVAFVACSVFIYGFSFIQPQDVEFPVFLEVSAAALLRVETNSTTDTETSTTGQTKPNEDSDWSDHAAEIGATENSAVLERRSRVAAASNYVPGWAADNVPVYLLALFACAFGALHCLAWNSPFPTSREQLIWRICSTTTTALPFVVISLMEPLKLVKHNRGSQVIRTYRAFSVALTWFMYVIGRITIIVLAFMSLRALPADAFRTIDWNSYIPHFAA